MEIKVAGTSPESIVDGRGIRYTLFTQGCPHHCKGCHNPQSWSADGGEWKNIEDIFAEFKKNPLLKGITFSGGEPFSQPEPLLKLAELVHSIGKDVTVYSGYTYEELIAMEDEAVKKLLLETDVLIDGRYVEEQRNLELLFRGSENQRVINMKATRDSGHVVEEEFD